MEEEIHSLVDLKFAWIHHDRSTGGTGGAGLALLVLPKPETSRFILQVINIIR